MEDYTVQGLEARIQSLCISNDSNNHHPQPSLVEDPLFQHYYSLRKEPRDEPGTTRFGEVVKFHADINLLAILDSQVFLDVVRATEPGRPLSYKALKVDVMKVQDEIPGGAAAVQEMFDFDKKLSEKHGHFVRSASALTMAEMYNKIVLRQYGIVEDPEFLALPEFQTRSYADTFRLEAPPYVEARAILDNAIATLRRTLKEAAQSVADIKNSLEFKKFRAKLTTAQQMHEAKLARSAKATQRAAYQTSLDFIRRLAETKMKNEKMHERRAKKNLPFKNINTENLQQLGNQTRTPLPSHVVQALSIMQTSHNDAVFSELKGKEEQDSEIGEENIHNAVQNLTLNGQPVHESIAKCWWLFNKIEIPDGFENVATEPPSPATPMTPMH